MSELNAKCDECGKVGPYDTQGGKTEQVVYMTDACDKGYTCCNKYLCLKQPCKIKIKCDQCGHVNHFERQAHPVWDGWNYLEFKLRVTIMCTKCTSTIIHPMCWNHECSRD